LREIKYMADHLHRRDFLASSVGLLTAAAVSPAPQNAPKKLAAVVTVYHLNSHAEMIAGRFLEGFNLNGTGARPQSQAVSLFTDQRPKNDLSRSVAKKHRLKLASTIAEALTLGGKDLAVDGVLLIAEHGNYPVNARGHTLYPRRRFFEEIVKVFRRSKRVVPVYCDKHLAASWEDAHWMYKTARELKIPLMAGSSVPVTWRKPPLDTRAGRPLTEMAAITFGSLDSYGIHALEMVQCLAERRQGGETGVAAVRCVEGPEVWKLGKQGKFDLGLVHAALARCEGAKTLKGKIGKKGDRTPQSKSPIPFFLEELEKRPILCQIEYRDGLKANLLSQNLLGEWTTAWREKGKAEPQTALFWCQDERPVGHFTPLVQGIEQMMVTGKPAWPVERTLLMTGVLDALLTSKGKQGARVETPHLAIAYKSNWSWKAPAPPPRGRPYDQP
jgi:hypothetical protein